VYGSQYNTSWALIIGINAYSKASPLLFARSDAEAMRDLLVTRFAFPVEHVITLLDADATRQRIHETYFALLRSATHPDDRVIVFFAGHGLTMSGRRGEVGFLVPVDGDPSDTASLMRWDEWTRNADLIPAKHILFLMDACYGGLALQRATPPGSMRFVGDMLHRYARQVLTAGKADEVVADSGGPRPNHSVFTGHLLDVLEGHTDSEIITANQVMTQVYERVARDPHSRQTPHYGFLDGDGDLIFNPGAAVHKKEDPGVEEDVLVQVPPRVEAEGSTVEQVKRYVADSSARILLDDLVGRQVRTVLAGSTSDRFPIDTRDNFDAVFADRLRNYESLVRPLQESVVLVARWGESSHRATLTGAFARLSDGADSDADGLTVWLGLRWYPTTLLLYSVGIAALAGDQYEMLAAVLSVSTGARRSGGAMTSLVGSTVRGMLDVDRANGFKRIPGHERQYVPRSEYLFKVLQPPLEDLLFLGRGYEQLFDRFEVLLSLAYLDVADGKWTPVGRFGYKVARGYGQDPLTELIAEANRDGDEWDPLRAGMFHRSSSRFLKLVGDLKELVQRGPWY
jgi:uncharacterized caspase-like protein